MTDNEIIKVLECCMQTENISCCAKCSLRDKDYCYSEVSKNALDLINRQKAEIERLENDKCSKIVKCIATDMEKAKSEAIKEFAERLKKFKIKPDYPWDDYFVTESAINNLVKEMTEETP